MVSPEKQIWHDFSSGKGGNIFSFIMEVEGLDFRGALELLARKAGIDLSQYQRGDGRQAKLKHTLTEILEWATKFYQVQFKGSKAALEYVFKKRAFNKDTVLAFRIGYSPNTNDALLKFLTKKGYSLEDIKSAGLITKRRMGWGDMFRGRLMIPLMDPQGLVVGFTARILVDDPNAPKYINTPQTPLYDKGRHVFGLHLAKDAIRKAQFAVMVEGNLDVIASHQAGVANVVATAGTALTESHVKAISRFTDDIRLSFDQDKAGLAATERSIPIVQKANVNLSIITIPSGKDPDELVRQDPALWRQAIAKKQYVIDWLIDRYSAQLDLASAQGKRQFTDVLLKTIKTLKDPVEQDHYTKKIAGIIDSSQAAVEAKLSNQKTEVKQKRRVKVEKLAKRDSGRQDHLLSLALYHPAARALLKELIPEIFTTHERQTVFNFLITHQDEKDLKVIAKALQDVADYVKIITSFQFEDLYRSFDSGLVLEEARQQRARVVREYVTNQTHKLALAQTQTEDETQKNALAEKAAKLTQLLRNNKD